MSKKLILYLVKVLLIGFGVVPFVLSLVMLLFSAATGEVMLPISAVLYIGAAYLAVRLLADKNLPDSFVMRYLPVVLPLVVMVLCWAVCMVISGGFYGHGAFIALVITEIAFLPIIFINTLMGTLSYNFYLPLIYNLAFVIFFLIRDRKGKVRQPISKGFMAVSVALILTSASVGSFVAIMRMGKVLPQDYGFKYGGGYSSVDLYPYDRANPNNILPKLERDSEFTISDSKKMPVLDGAEAAYPVYSAFANACYIEKLSDNMQAEKVPFTNTTYAFERLISGEVDIFFGATPSKAQQEKAEKAGKKLVLTPIGKEAFVFFINKKNDVNDINTESIKDIYSGKVRNWSDLGGAGGRIVAFQRPENSGSQTIMQSIMGDTPLVTPLKEESVSGMGGVSENVANYRNYPGAIGYSFRFFTTGMAGSTDEIKLLSIDGIAPTPDNIISGEYPYTVPLYAVTVEDNPLETVKPFLAWMQGEQGQKLVEKVGYMRYQ